MKYIDYIMTIYIWLFKFYHQKNVGLFVQVDVENNDNQLWFYEKLSTDRAAWLYK